jgi:hypothetical protein
VPRTGTPFLSNSIRSPLSGVQSATVLFRPSDAKQAPPHASSGTAAITASAGQDCMPRRQAAETPAQSARQRALPTYHCRSSWIRETGRSRPFRCSPMAHYPSLCRRFQEAAHPRAHMRLGVPRYQQPAAATRGCRRGSLRAMSRVSSSASPALTIVRGVGQFHYSLSPGGAAESAALPTTSHPALVH